MRVERIRLERMRTERMKVESFLYSESLHPPATYQNHRDYELEFNLRTKRDSEYAPHSPWQENDTVVEKVQFKKNKEEHPHPQTSIQ